MAECDPQPIFRSRILVQCETGVAQSNECRRRQEVGGTRRRYLPEVLDGSQKRVGCVCHCSLIKIGSIRLASFFLTFPTRWLTGPPTTSPPSRPTTDFICLGPSD